MSIETSTSPKFYRNAVKMLINFNKTNKIKRHCENLLALWFTTP